MQARTRMGPAWCVLAALALSACGGGGSSVTVVATPAPDVMVSRAARVVEEASSVRVTGRIDGGLAGHPLTLEISIQNGRGASGSLSESGVSFRLIALAGSVYIKGTPAFWQRFGGAEVAAQLQGRWLRAPASSGEFKSLQTITNLHTLLGALLSGHGALTQGARSTIDGRRVIALHDASGHGTLYVAARGPGYPIRLARSGPQGGRLDFSDFGARVRITAPADAVDISALTSG